jgi:hypothetical protein
MAWIEGMNPRSKEHFKVNFALTERLKSGPIIFMQNILNSAALSLNTPLSLSLSLSWIIWLGSTSVDIGPTYVNNWKRLGRLPF